jgi:nucleoside phosphorylase
MGSGAAVISNAEYVAGKIQHQRKLLAIDMETYAVFYSTQNCTDPKPKALSIKCISDHADAHKNDAVQKYGSFISANATDYIIRNILFS